MKKWMLGLTLLGLIGTSLLLSAMTPDGGNLQLDITRTTISQQNTTTEYLIQATQTASGDYGLMATSPSTPAMTATAVSNLMGQEQNLPNTGGGNGQPIDNPIPQSKRVVIYTANLRIVANAPNEVIEQIGALIEDLGGWIVTSNANSQSNNRVYGTISVRVPAGQLNYAVETIKGYGVSVTSEVISGSDVTNQYVDMSSRLRNLQATEAQLQNIMEEAEDVQGVLAVFNELSKIRGEIESIQGQLNYYDESSAFSSLSVNVDPVIPTPQSAVTPVWNPSNAVDTALVELEHNIQQFVDGTIHFVIISGPFILMLLVIGGLIARIGWSVWKRKR